jgi:DNA helicase-2/ATP-dependent DNA helicase PcrA
MSHSWNADVRGTQVLPLINADARTIRVEAGPGTGKTFGLVRRVERILHPDGLNQPGGEVLVVAFNRVIAAQLQADIGARLETFIHDGDPVIRTVHALCVQVIGSEVRLLLPHEREAMVFDVLEWFPALRELYDGIHAADQALREHEAQHADHTPLWQAARRWLTRHHAQLVSDLPGLLLARLESGDFPGQLYSHVIVDEFQDLTPGEQRLVFRLRRDSGQLVALGDPRQSIYRFRGNDREGLAKLEDLAAMSGDAVVTDLPMNECQRCPGDVVRAANTLMSLSGALAMVPVSAIPANLHVVAWSDPGTEAAGMARAIVDNVHAHPGERHLVMVTRRQFGYALRDRISELDPALTVHLSFSEGLLETWAVREAFLLFCLLSDPDRATWRAWFSYQNSTTGKHFKATERNSDAYLRFLGVSNDHISAEAVQALTAEPRTKHRGKGGSILWDRATRFLQMRGTVDWTGDDGGARLRRAFYSARWTGDDYVDADTARRDMELVLNRSVDLFQAIHERHPGWDVEDLMQAVAQRLRYEIATREPFGTDTDPDLHVATLWGAKGVTAEHVYMLGVCQEAVPGERRDEYPGTDDDFVEEQRRLFYVSITRTKRTLVISRALRINFGEAKRLGLAVGTGGGGAVGLQMSPFLRDIRSVLPASVAGASWGGCVVP